MPPAPVPSFTRLGDAANAAVEDLALRLALNHAVKALALTEGNLTVLLKEKPSASLGKWREEVRKALQVATDAQGRAA